MLSGMLGALPAWAQFEQYTTPGSLGQRPEARKEQLADAVKEARWHLGALRLAPSLELKNVAFISNVFASGDANEVSDLTATLSGGLRAYLPFGAKTTAVAYALPEYAWWRDIEANRRVNGRYGGGVYAYFNRLTVEAELGREETQGFVTPETPQQISYRRQFQNLSTEVQVGGPFWLFGSARSDQFRHLVAELDPRVAALDLLDRDEDVFRLGAQARLSNGWSLGLGAERSQVQFRSPRNNLDNSGTAPILVVRYEGKPWHLDLDLAYRSLEADGAGSRFVPFDDLTGLARVELQPRHRLRFGLYGARTLAYSTLADYAYFTQDRLGLVFTFNPAGKVSLRTFVEEGSHNYVVAAAGALARKDDVRSYGASIQLHFRRVLTLELGVIDSRYDSNLPGQDRNVTQLITGISLDAGGARWP